MSELHLIPRPQRIEALEGAFALRSSLFIHVSDDPDDRFAAKQLLEELERIGVSASIGTVPENSGGTRRLFLAPGNAGEPFPEDPIDLAEASGEEGYFLRVAPESVRIESNGAAGLFYGVQTLKQLIRANRGPGNAIPGLEILDWPGLTLRGFQDDMTRGPSSRLEVLKEQVRLAAEFKMNFFSYYMEYQFAFTKHPEIGPPDGSLTREELRELVAYARPYHVQIIGNQQSFGHFTHILKHSRYAHLRENPHVISPVFEETYQLLDDLFADQTDLLESPLFNVNCDETWGLGEGPSKERARELGVGVVYAEHMKRIHELLAARGKRMMMWGDIILNHPEELHRIPKDTVMLTWGYDPRESYEDQIVPFARAGYDFMVCPGTNGWGRVYPDLQAAIVNIRNFIRDGARHGAMGALVTTWRDLGDNLTNYDWHGIVWGAANCWRPGEAEIADFNRDFGPLFFGEHQGRVEEALLAMIEVFKRGYRMFSAEYWIPREDEVASRQGAIDWAEPLYALSDRAVRALRKLPETAEIRKDAVEYFIHMAERSRFIAWRMLEIVQAADIAEEGYRNRDAELLRQALHRLRGVAAESRRLREEYARLWLIENKPYALDWTTDKMDRLTAHYEGIAEKLDRSIQQLEKGLEPAWEDEWRLVEHGIRRSRPMTVFETPLETDVPWGKARARIGMRVGAEGVERTHLPVEIDLSDVMGTRRLDPGRVNLLYPSGNPETRESIPCQVLSEGKGILTLLPRLPADATAELVLLLQEPGPTEIEGEVWLKREGDDFIRMGNGVCEILIGSQGGHIYEWKVSGATDITAPGRTDWMGFLDTGRGPERTERNRMIVEAEGPLLGRIRFEGPHAFGKTISLYAGASFVDVTFTHRPHWLWNYDNESLTGWKSDQPVEFLFSNGHGGSIPLGEKNEIWQFSQPGTNWAVKRRADGLTLGMILPNETAQIALGSGGPWGGVGVEQVPIPAHVLLVGALLEEDGLSGVMDNLRTTMNFTNPLRYEVFRMEVR